MTALLTAVLLTVGQFGAGMAAPTNPVIKSSDWFAEIPDILRFSQDESERIQINDHFFYRHLLPHTAQDSVDREITGRILEMEQNAIDALNLLCDESSEAELDTGAMIFRTGTKIMSFEIVASGIINNEQVYVDTDAYVYDMETGTRLTLENLFATDSAGWDILEQEARKQLTEYFPDTEADTEELNMLTSREYLGNMPFSMTAGRLIFHYRADELYDGKNTLMNVEIYYSEIRDYMREEIRGQTDNTGYRLAAITFDDGPAKGSTNLLINKLMKYGVPATFFNVGEHLLKSNGAAVCREHDLCFDVGSHSYVHQVSGVKTSEAETWMKEMDDLYISLFGIRPVLFRAPGGNFNSFIKAGNDLPMIKWSVIGGDAEDKTDYEIIQMLSGRTNAGDIVLMHDLANRSSQFMEESMPTIESRNVLCVTVRELCSIYGLELNSSEIVTSCEEQVLGILEKGNAR